MAKLFPGFIALGYVPFTEDPIENLKRMVLPVFALSLPMIANLSRLVRSAMLDALSQQYIRTAKASGFNSRRILWLHTLPNALIPIITIIGMQFAALVTGTIVIENVFYLPGLGKLIFQAISNRDLPTVQALVMLFAAIVIIANFIVDIAYSLIDPRLKERT